MMKHIMLKPIAIFSILLLITLTASSAPATDDKAVKRFNELAARDTITLTIQEVKETVKFIRTIQQLKVVQLNEQNNTKLVTCAKSLISHLRDVESKLRELRHMKVRDLNVTTPLKKTTAYSVQEGKNCSRSLKNLDQVMVSVLNRKLDGISVMVDDALIHVKDVGRDTHHIETGPGKD